MSDPSDGPIARLNTALEGRYRVEREIGQGGMATVYLAEDLKHHRQVALKVLKPELAAVVGAERFLAEIETTANLQHPHILPLYDSGQVDGLLFYVMPYIEGETLRERLDREKQLPVEEAVVLARKVAGALQFAHDRGVIHRDMKPANILFQGGEPIVADFGIALAVGMAGGSRLTETGLSVGTPYYMSPEQATGDRGVGPASDIYGLACVVYEMLVGEPPYLGNTAQAVLGKIIQGEPVSATAARKTVPANVDAAIRKGLEKLPADRFTGAHDFARALAEPGFRHGVGEGSSGGPGRGGSVGASGWSKGAKVTAGTAVLLAVASLLLGRALLRSEPPAAPVWVEAYLGGVEARGGGGLWGAELTMAPDGSGFIFTGSGPAGVPVLWRRTLDRLVPEVIPGTEGARTPVYSPDGRSVAFILGNQVRVASLGGETVSTIVPEGVADQGLDWGPDDMIYYGSGGDLLRVSPSGGEPETVTVRREGEEQLTWPDVLPDERGLFLTRLEGGGVRTTISVLSFETGELRDLVPGGMARYAASGHIIYTTMDGTLLGAPFDLDGQDVAGPSQSLVEGVQVNPIGGSLFAISDNGTLLYQTGEYGDEFRLRESWLDGSSEPRALDLEAGSYADPRWSPDGRSVAYAAGPLGERNLFVYDVDQGTAPRQLTFEGDNSAPVWSPDGSRIVFASIRGGAPSVDLYLVGVDDDNPPIPILETQSPEYPRSWTSDDLIVFEGGVPVETSIWTIAPEAGSDPVPYLVSGEDTEDISVSPDGDWAVYQSAETGVEELYARSFPEPRQPLRVSQRGGQFPRWNPNGTGVFYWSGEGLPVDTLYAADVTTEPVFRVLSRRIVHIGDYLEESWDIHPDGNRIIGVEPLTPSTITGDHAFLVFNFFETLP